MHSLLQFLRLSRENPLESEKGELRKRVRRLGQQAKVVFVASCAERWFAHYQAFRHDTQWDADDRCRQALNQLWLFAEGIRSEAAEVNRLSSDLSELIPMDVDFPDWNSILIQTAPGVVSLGLELMVHDDPEISVRAGMAGRDAADQVAMLDIYKAKRVLAGEEIRDAHARVMVHPLMIKEISAQAADLIDLEANPAIGLVLPQLRRRAEQC